MKYSIFLLINLLGFTPLVKGQQNNTKSIYCLGFEEQVDSLVSQYTDLDIFSGVVLVAHHGEPVYHEAFGLANRESMTPNTLNTRFDIGSMNKTFTKVVILQLIREGKLSLRDTLGKFLPGFPPQAAGNITVEHLLNHRSGYDEYFVPAYRSLPLEQKGISAAIQVIREQPLIFEPGTEQAYSNAGYVLLGGIIEKVTGQSYYNVVEMRIVRPLQLKATYLRDKYHVPHRAIGYYKNMKGELENNEWLQEVPKPDGGFYSTTTDILTFYCDYYYGNKLLDDSTKTLDALYPFYQKHRSTGGAVVQAGGFEGANTVVYEILRDQLSVIVFANMDEIVAENLGAGILAIIRGQQPEPPHLSAIQSVYIAYMEHGISYVRDHWDELTINFHPADPKDLILNQIGYQFLQDRKVKQALVVFKLNTEMFPEVANCWDSYGEALLAAGNRKEALEAYTHALELDQGLQSSLEAVEKITKMQ